MIEISTHVEGLDELFRKLDRVAAVEVLKPPMEASLKILEDYMKDYPPKSDGPMRFKTAKQRRYFFWALRNGRIVVPYSRTGKLGQAWSTNVRIDQLPNGLHGEIGTGENVPHARYVQSKQQQAEIHRGNWRTDAMAIEVNRAEIIQRFWDTISAALAR